MTAKNTDADFWRHVDRGRAADCWRWGGHCDSKGYGIFTTSGRRRKAHRVAFELNLGAPPPGAFVMHLCNNPPCVNPDHLVCGSPGSNTFHRDQCGRQAMGVTNGGGDALTPDGVRRIRTMSEQGINQVQIARAFGVSRSLVGQVLRGEIWTHVRD